MAYDDGLQEFARIFRCAPESADTYVNRIHERMGYEVPMDAILAAMKKIAPKRLSMDTIVERLKKTGRLPKRARASRAQASTGEAALSGKPASRPGRVSAAAAASKPSAMTQISRILTTNWDRGRQQGLKPPVMTAEKFVRSTQSIAGTPRPTVARVLQSIVKLDRSDVLLTPNLVADDINETEEA